MITFLNASGATCVEEGFYTYHCYCDNSADCQKNPDEGGSPLVPVNDVVAVQDVVVREGGR